MILTKLVILARNIAKPLTLVGLKENWILLGVSDAAYDIVLFEGRVGYEIRLVNGTQVSPDVKFYPENTDANILCWSSKVLKNKVTSTTSAELHALARVVKVMPAYLKLTEALKGIRPQVIYEVDSKPLISQLHTGKSASEPALRGLLDYVIQEFHKRKASVRWVPTAQFTAVYQMET
eukprot:GHVR01038712.1.p1 GENE.GHVR01038712.1~~GHVR01038712.1.p1  ORF type:complete len:178 (+),score=8.86 GHVR01038712.1:290-823(+)